MTAGSRRLLTIAAIGVTCLGLGASVASLVDYLGPAPTFCSASGCATVRESAWAYPLGIPMPAFGVAFFAALLALAFAPGPRARWLRVAGALAGCAWAMVLVGVQAFALHAFCKLCMVADSSALALALAVVCGADRVRFRWPQLAALAPAVAALPVAFALLGAPAPADEVAAPAGGSALPAVPAAIAAEQAPGVVTVVEFVDFECPFCRRLAPRLADAVARAPSPVRVVRKMVPLAMHPHARDAALAWCCADAQGKGDAMAEALFAAPVDDLTPDGCAKLAAQVGCDMDRYQQSLADPRTSRRIDADVAAAKSAGARGLPTVFIGPERITGANHTAADLLATIDTARAARR